MALRLAGSTTELSRRMILAFGSTIGLSTVGLSTVAATKILDKLIAATELILVELVNGALSFDENKTNKVLKVLKHRWNNLALR